MKFLFTLLMFVATGFLAYGQSQSPMPPQAPPIFVKVTGQAPPVEIIRPKMSEYCDCFGRSDCTCHPGLCQCESCQFNYSAKRHQALVERSPLIIWVGWTCPPCIAKLKAAGIDAVHVSVEAGRFKGYIQQGVIVGVPRGEDLFVVGEFAPGVTGEQIVAAIQPPTKQPDNLATPTWQPRPFQPGPVFMPATTARPVVSYNSPYQGSMGTGHIPIHAGFAGQFGGISGYTNCGPSG